MDTPVPFRIDRIGIRGGIGVGLLVAVVVAGVLASLPVLRGPILVAMAIGIVIGAGWIVSRRSRPLDARTPPLSLGLAEARRRTR